MSSFLKALWGFVISRNVAVVLLALVTGMLAVGAFLPNPELMPQEDIAAMLGDHPAIFWLGERYNSQKLASGYLFGFVGVFLVLSTTLCSVDRFVSRYRDRVKAGEIPLRPFSSGGMKASVNGITPERVADFSKVWLKRNRLRVVSRNEGALTSVVGIGGRVGFWGSVLFHSVLITALIGVVIYYLGGYRGTLVFTEGQSYPLEKNNFTHIVKEPIWGMNLPEVRMGLLRQHSIYALDDPWYPLDYVARFRVVRTSSGESWDKDVRINDPLVIDGKKFLLIRGGFSPRILLRRPPDTNIADSYVSLREEGGTRDDFSVAEEGLRIYLKLYPDFVLKDGEPDTKSPQLGNPFLFLRVHDKSAVLYKGTVPLGGEVKAGGYYISFPDVRRWVLMEMVGEPGIGFFFIISFVGILGVAIRMLDPDERLYVFLMHEGNRVDVEVVPLSRHFAGLLGQRAERLLAGIQALAEAEAKERHAV